MKKFKQCIALLLCIVTIIIFVPVTAFAEEQTEQENDNIYNIGEVGGYLSCNSTVIKTIAKDKKFSARQGHGFAAENGNNLFDVFTGKKAEVVGNDNVKNGPDRKIVNRNGEVTWIQDKYYSTASGSIEACFDENGFRYLDSDNKPMQIEVPADQYDDAVLKMSEKIKQGKVQGITNPEEAANIVKKGKLTYKQAVNITKAGNIDSLTYDAANGVITAAGGLAIGFVLDYALCLINGESNADALKSAVTTGFQTGGVVFATYVISSQLTKTGLVRAFTPASEAIVKKFGEGFAKSILTTNGVDVATLSAEQLTKQAAYALKTQAVFAVVTVAVLETGDVIEIFRGRISKEQFISNLAVTASSVVVGVGGYYAGGAIGTLICPGPGTVIGGIVGGIAGGFTGGYLADKAAKAIYEGDGAAMYKIVEDEFSKMAFDYVISEDEAKSIADNLNKKLNDDTLKDMYSSNDREAYIKKIMEPLFETEVSKRAKIEMPTEAQIRTELLADLEGIVFIH